MACDLVKHLRYENIFKKSLAWFEPSFTEMAKGALDNGNINTRKRIELIHVLLTCENGGGNNR